jgi:hypothetical protein
MKKITISLCMLFLSAVAFAQVTFYDAIDKNGPTSEYQEFWSVGAKGDGTYEIGGKRHVVTLEVVRTTAGIPLGFSATDVATGKRLFSSTEVSDYSRADSYPLTSYMQHTYTKEGYVMIGDYLFELTKIYDDHTFKSISKIYVKKGSNEAEGVAKDGKKKKKKGFFAKLKSAVKDVNSLGPEHKKASAEDLGKMLNDYLTVMYEKQKAYTLTSKDKSDMRAIKMARENEDADIKKYNDSIKATPAYKKMIAHREWMDKEINVEVVNTSGRTLWVGSTKEAFITRELSNGASTTMNCQNDLYYYYSDRNGTSGTKFYTNKSACGSSVSTH